MSVNESSPDAYVLDNYYPSILETYKGAGLSAEFMGVYEANEFPLTILISEKDGLTHISLLDGQFSNYMVPLANGSFQSLDKNMLLSVKKDENGEIEMQLAMKSFGLKLTGSKK